jgi:predicted nuclease of restriction endonuclease-like (RecB) superfamily
MLLHILIQQLLENLKWVNMTKQHIDKKGYNELFKGVVEQIQQSRIKAANEASRLIGEMYFNIGRIITEKQQQYGWGESIVEKLATDLNEIFDGKEGYSPQNLWFMRQFFTEYKETPELLELAFSIPWGQNILIFSKIKDIKEREYYLKATAGNAWSRSVLVNQIKADAYQVYLENPKKHNFNLALPEHLAEQADETLKSRYNLDFLGVTKPILERQLENLMVENVKRLILELGYGFCFIANQYRLWLGKKHYDVDLLFFHRKLRCLIAIELKTTEFAPEHSGKLDFYLELLNKQLKQHDENPSIGIILCAEKDNLEVEYSLNVAKNPIGVAEYQLTKRLPKQLKGQLPSVKELTTKAKEILKEMVW